MKKAIQQPKVSVLIPSYNHEKYIIDCLKGLYSQDYNNFEVIIRDDGSNDNTPTLIKEFLCDITNTNNIHTIVEYGENIGVVNNLNSLIKKSSGEIIMGCASDDIFLQGRIRIAVETHQKYPDIDLIACNGQVISDNGDLIRSSFYSLKDEGLTQDSEIKIFKNTDYKSSLSLALGGFGMSYRKNLLEQINYQLPKSLLFEDGYLSFLASIQNGAIILKEPLIKYRRSANSLSRVDSALNDDNILKQEKKFLKMFLSLESNKLDYLTNKHKTNRIIDKNLYKSINLTKQKIRIINIKMSTIDNLYNFQEWIYLLWLLIVGFKTKMTIYILLTSLYKKILRKRIIFEYISRSSVL